MAWLPETSIVEIVPGLGQCNSNLETNALGMMSDKGVQPINSPTPRINRTW